MPKTPEEYLKAPYGKMLFRNENGSYTAEMLEFSGCFAEGATAEEAVRNLDESAREWIEASLRLGRDIPEPFTSRGYSGTISLRIPKAIHRQAARMAEREGVSLNQYLLAAVSARVGADDLFNRMVQAWTSSAAQIGIVMNATITNNTSLTVVNQTGATNVSPFIASTGTSLCWGSRQLSSLAALAATPPVSNSGVLEVAGAR